MQRSSLKARARGRQNKDAFTRAKGRHYNRHLVPTYRGGGGVLQRFVTAGSKSLEARASKEPPFPGVPNIFGNQRTIAGSGYLKPSESKNLCVS